MLILGSLLVVLSVAAVALLVAYNNSGGPEQMIVLFGRDLVSVNPLQAFLAGIVVALVFCIGLWMVVSAGRRSRAVRADYRAARREARAAARERDDLAQQLERERAATTTTTTTTADTPPPVATEEETTGPRGFGRHFRGTRRTDEVSNERTTSG